MENSWEVDGGDLVCGPPDLKVTLALCGCQARLHISSAPLSKKSDRRSGRQLGIMRLDCLCCIAAALRPKSCLYKLEVSSQVKYKQSKTDIVCQELRPHGLIKFLSMSACDWQDTGLQGKDGAGRVKEPSGTTHL